MMSTPALYRSLAYGVMLKGTLITESGKVYCLDGEGKMVVEPVTLTPDKDGRYGIRDWQSKV